MVFGAAGIFLHAASTGGWFSTEWWNAGSAQAGLILDGAWWRAFTALGLHAYIGHLAANLVMGGILVLLLSERLGTGLTWLAILLAGGAGNALNAWVQSANHTSVGASTGVFTALGLLATQSWKRDTVNGLRGLRCFLPLAGAVIFLSFLGVGGERTDVTAHIFGFVISVLLGALLHAVDRYAPRHGIVPHGFGAAALGLFALACLLAFHVA